MKIGIIVEYNPFHYGHIYHIQKIKEKYPNSVIIAVMSGNITERGDISIIDKWDKTRIALLYGVDLVVELPYTYCSQSADTFTYGAIKILNSLKVDKIIFGSESGDTSELERCASIQLTDDYNTIVSKYIKEGINYPTALSKALYDLSGIEINSPNDILGLGYIKEIIKNNYNISYEAIKRTNDYKGKELTGKISSATSIRECLKNNKDIKDYIPKEEHDMIRNIFMDDYFKLLKYKIISSNDLTIYVDIDIDIHNRLKEVINVSNSYIELINNMKNKSITESRIKRILGFILFSYTKEENLNKELYIRILGFTSIGQDHLNTIKKSIELPIISNYSSDKNNLLKIETRIISTLDLVINNNLLDKEIKMLPIKKED